MMPKTRSGTVQSDMWAVLAVVLALSVSLEADKDLPSYITPCQRNSKILECIVENFERLRPHLPRGVPSLSVPPLNPLKIPSATVQYRNGTLSLSDLNVFFVEKLMFEGFHHDFGKDYSVVKLLLTALNATGRYRMKGSFFGISFDGEGDAQFKIENAHLTIKLRSNETKVGNETFLLDVAKVGFELPEVAAGFLNMENLVKGDLKKSQQANEVLNRNVLHFSRPLLDEVFAGFFAKVVSDVFAKFSLEQLFPKES